MKGYESASIIEFQVGDTKPSNKKELYCYHDWFLEVIDSDTYLNDEDIPITQI